MCVVCYLFPVVDIVRPTPSYVRVRVACVSEVGEEEEEEKGRIKHGRKRGSSKNPRMAAGSRNGKTRDFFSLVNFTLSSILGRKVYLKCAVRPQSKFHHP